MAIGIGRSRIWLLSVLYCTETSYGVSEMMQPGETLLVHLVLELSLDGFIFPSSLHQVITLEGWVDIMYFVMDAHSFYNFIYFILLIIVSGLRGRRGSFWHLERAEWSDPEEQGR